ncbi:hypothetical protein Droror1_Dr00000816 [Drosera rotundifolia]
MCIECLRNPSYRIIVLFKHLSRLDCQFLSWVFRFSYLGMLGRVICEGVLVGNVRMEKKNKGSMLFQVTQKSKMLRHDVRKLHQRHIFDGIENAGTVLALKQEQLRDGYTVESRIQRLLAMENYGKLLVDEELVFRLLAKENLIKSMDRCTRYFL